MRTSKLLSTYYFEQRSLIIDNLSLAKKSDIKAVHQLRVAIKKLRAYSVFLQDLTGGQLQIMKQLTALNQMFKQAGKVRDAQVQQQLLGQYEIQIKENFHDLRRYLEKAESKNTPLFQKKIELLSENIFNKVDSILPNALDSVDFNSFDKTLQNICTNKLNSLSSLKKHNGNEEQLHDFRKLFKELMYTYKFCNRFSDNFSPQLSPKRMDDFAENLGHWHDQTIMLTYIEKFKTKHKSIDIRRLNKIVTNDSLSFMNNFEQLLNDAKLAI